MKLVGAIIVFLLICAISAWLFLASIPVVVHRITPELDQTLLILAGLLALAIVWFMATVPTEVPAPAMPSITTSP